MGLFSELGASINENTRQPRNAKSKSVPEKSTNKASNKVYYNEEEEGKQANLWHDAEKKKPWYDAPPKVKVTTMKDGLFRKKTIKDGVCHINIEFTVGMTPAEVYNLFTHPQTKAFFDLDKWRPLMENKSIKVVEEIGPRLITKVEKSVAWDLLFFSIPIPITLIVDENRKELTANYKKAKIMCFEIFFGNCKVEPLYVDSERLCNHRLPKNRQEYEKCSGGQGKIGSKVTMNQYFKPYPIFNLPPVSWYIRWITINTTKTLVTMLQNMGTMVRKADRHTKQQTYDSK